ncbi:hydrogenase large subunit [Labrys wisconsinensis]|uniref:Ni,Fe-hydrogenase III large subunit n=1 Tax=Labrys wisconsinensis TaxID=425677 RepID=A0ABU0JD64_9HYPH|nr:nickel-dependent hydrogenase large subunit [Labrys wisconsinensis]MDQ0472219.1 Ni,Fe-hydrogenase III large subunit [Labrys wisconsinensis]
MTLPTALLAAGRRVEETRPHPRVVVDDAVWQAFAARLAAGEATLLGLWGDGSAVHMALLDETGGQVAIATRECPDGRYASVGRAHPPAIRLERALQDLTGLEATGLPDGRPWLDHGRWDRRHPLAAAPAAPAAVASAAPAGALAYPFLPAEGEGLHQIPVGPVHAGIIEPGHFRFTANGETVVRLEERLGYVHRGVEALMAGKPVAEAARLAGRTSGDSTVAYALAFARAVETALGIDVPLRAVWLRALMAEIERLANHFGDIGAICNDAAFALMHAHCGVLRERVLRTAAACFGHRLMMDRIGPGGVASDIAAAGIDQIRDLVRTVRQVFPALVGLYDNTASLQDRTVGTGRVSAALVRQFGCGGFVGRASGRAFDARRHLAYPPYDALAFTVPTAEDGDVNARLWIRIREVEESLSLVSQILDGLPAEGALAVPVAATGGPAEGLAIVEGFRGDILAFVRLDADGRVARCHLRDPSWFQWPLLEAAIEGNIVADFPLCNKSFNCSYAGHDL